MYFSPEWLLAAGLVAILSVRLRAILADRRGRSFYGGVHRSGGYPSDPHFELGGRRPYLPNR